MKLFKKINAAALSAAIVVASVFGANPKESYAATSCKKVLKQNVTYKYDIDGDGDLDTIKIYTASGDLKIKVNKCVKTLINDYDPDYHFEFTTKIYDFNKHDKSKEIVFEWVGPSDGELRLLKFRNSTCKVNRDLPFILGGNSLKSYDPNTGIVTFTDNHYGIYSKFEQAIGDFICYSKIKVNGYTLTNQTTANTDSFVRKNKYIASRKLTAYTSTSGTKKAFTISKGSPAYVYALYQKGNTRYVKVKNKQGKYGYVKAGSTLLFKRNSCIWAQ